MTRLPAPAPDDVAAADDAVRAVLLTQYGAELARLVLVDAVAGAGKTALIVDLARRLVQDPTAPERVAISANTDGQSFEIVARLLATGCPVVLFAKAGKVLPDFDTSAAPLVVISREHELVALCPPGEDATEEVLAARGLPGPCFAVVANSAKWSFVNGVADSSRPLCRPVAPLLVLDEAYQLHDHAAEQLLSIGERWVCVGDPGQIDPPVTIDVTEFVHRDDGPHRPFPLAQRERARTDDAGFVHLSLPYTRRCPADTTTFLEAFYDGPVQSLVPDGLRRLELDGRPAPAAGGRDAADRPDGIDGLLERFAAPAPPAVLAARLPAAAAGVTADDGVASAIASIIARLFERKAHLVLGGEARPLRCEDVMVLATHHDQLSVVRQALARAELDGVRVGTADALQGLDAPVTIAWHPLSGVAALDAFHCDAGRTCVMLSRHTVCCIVCYRDGTPELLEAGAPSTHLVPSRSVPDVGESAWAAQRALFARLAEHDRIVELTPAP